MSDRLLTFEVSADGEELFVHGNANGLRALATTISRLLDQVDAGHQAHDHLMTKAWSGTELSSEPQGQSTRLLNKVTIHAWPKKP